MHKDTYDYIIVGAGSAGCVLANRLSKDPKTTVCIIEAGGKDTSPRVQVPAGILSLYNDPKYDYSYMSVPQPELKNRRIPLNRGKALGGSSAINPALPRPSCPPAAHPSLASGSAIPPSLAPSGASPKPRAAPFTRVIWPRPSSPIPRRMAGR